MAYEKNYALIPSVGDYFSVDSSMLKEEATAAFSGKVRSRVFHYLRRPNGDSCYVNIVIEEFDNKEEWGSSSKSDPAKKASGTQGPRVRRVSRQD